MGLMTHSKSKRGAALSEQAGALIQQAGERVGPAVEHAGERAGELIQQAGERLGPAVEHAGGRAGELIEQARERARESDLPTRVAELVTEKVEQASAAVPGTTAHAQEEKKVRRRKRRRRVLLLGLAGAGAAYVARRRAEPGFAPGPIPAPGHGPTSALVDADDPVAEELIADAATTSPITGAHGDPLVQSDPLTDPLDEGGPVVPD